MEDTHVQLDDVKELFPDLQTEGAWRHCYYGVYDGYASFGVFFYFRLSNLYDQIRNKHH